MTTLRIGCWWRLLNSSFFEVLEDLDEAGRERFLEAPDSDVDRSEKKVERDRGGEAHGGADQGDTDFVGNLRRLDFVSAANAAKRSHHAQYCAEEAEERAAFDDGGNPAGAVFEFAEHVLRQQFRQRLPQGVVSDIAVQNGNLRELRQCPVVLGALLRGLRVLPGVELGNQF